MTAYVLPFYLQNNWHKDLLSLLTSFMHYGWTDIYSNPLSYLFTSHMVLFIQFESLPVSLWSMCFLMSALSSWPHDKFLSDLLMAAPPRLSPSWSLYLLPSWSFSYFSLPGALAGIGSPPFWSPLPSHRLISSLLTRDNWGAFLTQHWYRRRYNNHDNASVWTVTRSLHT